MARPRKEIDFTDLDKLCEMQCTKDEICWFLQIDEKTLTARIKDKHGVGFSDYYKKASSGGKISLRRKQFEVAMNGNTALLIFLGKQYLGQADKIEQSGNEDKPPLMLAYKIDE